MSALEPSAASRSGPDLQASPQPGRDPDAAPGHASPLRFSVVESALRLVVGSALIGRDELVRRMQVWEQETLSEDRAVAGQAASDEDRVRYALIGFLFAAQHSTGRRLNQAVNQYQRHNPGRELGKTLDHVARSPLMRPLVRPLRSPLDTLARRWGDDVERWVRIGRIGERDSRSLANKATGELIDDVIGHLAQNRAVTDLVQQQGVGLAGEVIDTVRQTTATADDVVEGFIWRMLRRPPRASSAAGGPPARQAPPKDDTAHE
jgi:hypothetical protein